MKNNRSIRWVIGAAVILIGLTGCQDDTAEAPAATQAEPTTVADTTVPAAAEAVEPEVKEVTPEFGGTLKVAMSPADTLDPLQNQISNVGQVLTLIFEPLFTLDETLKPVPVLVDSYNFAQEGTALTLALKPGVLFHNGESLTTADVVYTIDAIREMPESPYNPIVQSIERMTVQDELNMTLYFDYGYAFTLNDLMIPIVPKGYHRSKDFDPMMPIGTGPYQFSDYQLMQKLELTAFPEWHGGDVYVENITAIAMNETDELETLFDQHLIDVMNPTKFNWIKYSEKEDQRIESYLSTNYTFIGFNMNREICQDLNVRQALAYGIDRETMLYNQFISHGAVTDSPVIPDSWFDDGEAPRYSYDFNKAKSLLLESGYEDGDGDGYFDTPDPSDETKTLPVTLNLLVNSSSPMRMRTAEVIHSELEKLGLKITVVEAEGQTYYETINAGDYDLILGGWQLTSKPDYVSILSSTGLQNVTGYSSEQMDLALDAIVRASDEEAVKNRVAEFEDLFANELPYISLYFLEGAVMAGGKVYGDLTPTVEGTFNNMSGLWLDLTDE